MNQPDEKNLSSSDEKVVKMENGNSTLKGRKKSNPFFKNDKTWITLVVLFAGVIAPALNHYQIHILDLAVLYTILAIGLNLTMGYAGQMNLAHAAFYSVGAYASAILTTKFHMGFWVSLPVAIIISTGFGILMGLPSLRVRSHYLAIGTLGLAVALNDALTNLTRFTGGPNGISGIPMPTFFGISLMSEYRYYYLVLVIAVLLFLFARLMMKYSIGRSFRAIREDHIASQALGINVPKQQILAFALSGLFAGVAGILYANMQSYISPDTFNLNEMFFILTIVIIGGLGSIYGSVIGAVVLIFAREWLASFQNWEQVIYGSLIVILVVFLPGGIISIGKLFQRRGRLSIDDSD